MPTKIPCEIEECEHNKDNECCDEDEARACEDLDNIVEWVEKHD